MYFSINIPQSNLQNAEKQVHTQANVDAWTKLVEKGSIPITLFRKVLHKLLSPLTYINVYFILVPNFISKVSSLTYDFKKLHNQASCEERKTCFIYSNTYQGIEDSRLSSFVRIKILEFSFLYINNSQSPVDVHMYRDKYLSTTKTKVY